MHKLPRALFFLQIAVLLVLSCRLPPPDSPLGRKISCASGAVQSGWPKILPSVNTCLERQDGNYEACLLGLISPVAGITEDVLACVLRDQSAKFGEAVKNNPDDAISSRAYTRSRTFMNKRQYVFDGP